MDNAIGFRNTYPCQDWIVIHPVDSSVQLTSIWNQMDKFIPQLNFKPIVTQHMLWHARCITQFTQKWQCLCYFLWKPCLYWNSIYFVCVLFLFSFFFWRDNSRRVRSHKKNSWDSVGRLGKIIPSFFCAQSGASIRLTVLLEMVWWAGTQGLFCPCLKAFFAPFFPPRLTSPGSPRMVDHMLIIALPVVP